MLSRTFWIIFQSKETFSTHKIALFRMVETLTSSRYDRKATRLLGRISLNLTLVVDGGALILLWDATGPKSNQTNQKGGVLLDPHKYLLI
jgi:hypothetical protein